MTYEFGARSEGNLVNVDSDLVLLARTVLGYGIFDFGITCGSRSKELQDRLYFEGRSKVRWPNSKHNLSIERKKALAYDFVIYVNGKATYGEKHKPSYYMAVGIFKGAAAELGINIRSGADWDGDFDTTDQNFHDLPHIEKLGE